MLHLEPIVGGCRKSVSEMKHHQHHLNATLSAKLHPLLSFFTGSPSALSIPILLH
jgi:hypothetical protein